MSPLPEAERKNARVKPSLKREDRKARIAEIIRKYFPDRDCLKKGSSHGHPQDRH